MVAKRLGVKVYGKKDCGKCEAAKDKLKMFGVPFTVHTLADTITLHEGWRTDGSAEILACYSHTETMPVILMDHEAFSYPEAMKKLKSLRDLATEAVRPTAQEAIA